MASDFALGSLQVELLIKNASLAEFRSELEQTCSEARETRRRSVQLKPEFEQVVRNAQAALIGGRQDSE